MKILLGCGAKKLDGWTTLDIQASVNPDIVHDLSVYPWPLADDCADEVICSHVIEHVIEQGHADQFFAFFRELWRICKHDAVCRIVVPDAMSEHAYADPWHKSFYTKNIFTFVSRKSIQLNVNMDSAMTPCEIDFDFNISGLNVLDSEIHARLVAVKNG